MSSGSPWSTATPASVNRKNKTSVITLSGDDITALDKSLFKIVTCNEDGGDYLEHHTYYFGDDGTTVVDLTDLVSHNHTSSDGGELIYIYTHNPETLDLHLIRPTDLIKANWNQTVTGTGSIEDGGGGSSDPYIRLRPNGTSGSGSTISYTAGFPKTSFNSPSILSFVGNFETATSLAFHGGVNADDVTAADSNTAKYQAEVCTTTNSNWWLRTATGSANSASDIGVAIGTTDTSVKIIHDPFAGTPNTKISIHYSGEFTKTTNIPTSATLNTQGNFMKFSIKNSTGADRPYRFKGSRISWYTDDEWTYSDV